jgi:hypothetical protein
MLHKIEIENFGSIGKPVVLDLTVSQAIESDRIVDDSVSGLRVPRRTFLFGANASGKSMLLRAVTATVGFALGRINWPLGQYSPFLPFNSNEFQIAPTRIQLELTGTLSGRDEDSAYLIYELVIGRKVSHSKAAGLRPQEYVDSEQLRIRSFRGKSRRVFSRQAKITEEGIDYDYKMGPEFELTHNDQRLKFVGPTRSLISVLAEYNHQLSIDLRERSSFFSNASVYFDKTESPNVQGATTYYQNNPDVLAALKQRLRILDLGLTDVYLDQQGSTVVPHFAHQGHSHPLSILFESDGTQSFYRLFPALFYGYSAGALTLLDEADRDLHPLMLPEIFGWFLEQGVANDAQLIATCHNPYLLEHLTKEEIVIVEKSSDGQTQAYPLAKLPATRRDQNLYAKYLSGVLGGVPRFG